MYSKIDLHSHFLPQDYKDALKKHIAGNPDGWPTPEWDMQSTLNFMEQENIQKTIFELSSPHINFENKEETLRLAQEANNLGADLKKQYTDKVEYLITLPLPYESESIAEVKRNLDNLGPVGISVPTNSRGHYWGNPEFDNLYSELNKDHSIVVLHPNNLANFPQNSAFEVPVPLYNFLADTTLTILNMMKNGFFDKYPNIKVVVPHAGAFLSIVADRWELFKEKFGKEYPISADAYQVMKLLYFDTAGATLPRQLPALMSLTDQTHILYGSDTPYTAWTLAKQLTNELENTDLISDDQKTRLFSSNAKDLFQI